MKNLLLLAFFIVATPFCASATLYNPFNYNYSFYGEGATTGVGSATMNVLLEGNTLTATLNNTSPLSWGDPAYTNTSGIDTFGFFVDESNLTLGPAIDSWTLTAYDTSSPSNLVTIGSDANAALPWSLEHGEQFLELVYLDYFATNGNGVGDALYNPLAVEGFGGNSHYFTEAILTIIFDEDDDDYPLEFGDGSGAYVRMQNVGSGGADSLKLFDYYEDDGGGGGGGGTPIPEPSTLILLGAGLVGLAVYRRKKN